ncbi:hypothetical protein L6452_30661 [Arctium lappa]|uniref:Uncharacterized protein n=1 Tax=Arctium lappa TaxID=4217 RepID=A0ACB8ZJ01_ARCLA|nr:hypothetical protein L6452_30661 [Arctium lappa]
MAICSITRRAVELKSLKHYPFVSLPKGTYNSSRQQDSHLSFFILTLKLFTLQQSLPHRSSTSQVGCCIWVSADAALIVISSLHYKSISCANPEGHQVQQSTIMVLRPSFNVKPSQIIYVLSPLTVFQMVLLVMVVVQMASRMSSGVHVFHLCIDRGHLDLFET